MNRDFKGIWISSDIWLDDRLTALEKIIFSEIDSLDTEEGCFASNEYLANFCQCSERKVTESIAKLVELGYIFVESFDGRRRILRSRVAESARLGSRKCDAESQNLRGSYNSIKIEDKIVNNKRVFKKPTIDEVKQYIKDNGYHVDADKFFDYYESNGWKVGKNAMKDWKATVRNWSRNETKDMPKTSYDKSQYEQKAQAKAPTYRRNKQ